MKLIAEQFLKNLQTSTIFVRKKVHKYTVYILNFYLLIFNLNFLSRILSNMRTSRMYNVESKLKQTAQISNRLKRTA